MSQEPTQGESESGTKSWRARPILAFVVRFLVFAIPLFASFLVLLVGRGLIYRPTGWLGLAIWALQAILVGAGVATLVSWGTRRALPLAMLLNLDLIFPGQAPSRLEIALRTTTVERVKSLLSEVRINGLGDSEIEAATNALELATLLSVHYASTRGRSARIMDHADLIALEIGMTDQDRQQLAWGVLLHDMGMLAIPTDILTKKGTLTDPERRVLKNHPTAGAVLLSPLDSWLGNWLLAASEHHERWDGAGYPFGLSGSDISLVGRIVAVADAYDAITSRRSYKPTMSAEAARQELLDCAGTQFDPTITHAFLDALPTPKEPPVPVAWARQIGAIALEQPALAAIGAVIALVGLVGIPSAESPDPLLFVDSSTETNNTTIRPPDIDDPATSTTADLTTTSSSTSSTTRVTRPDPTTTLPPTTAAPPPTTRRPSNPTTTAQPTTTEAPATTTTAAPTSSTTAPPPTIVTG